MNKLRRVWHLGNNSHTSVVWNCAIARVSYVYNNIFHRYFNFVSRTLANDSFIVKIIISDSINLTYTSIGYNYFISFQVLQFI